MALVPIENIDSNNSFFETELLTLKHLALIRNVCKGKPINFLKTSLQNQAVDSIGSHWNLFLSKLQSLVTGQMEAQQLITKQ